MVVVVFEVRAVTEGEDKERRVGGKGEEEG